MNKPIEFRFTKLAEKFLAKNSSQLTKDDTKRMVKKAISVLNGTEKNIDIKKLRGYKQDTFRIRRGDIRIIFSFEDDEIVIRALIEEIDRRGNIFYA